MAISKKQADEYLQYLKETCTNYKAKRDVTLMCGSTPVFIKQGQVVYIDSDSTGTTDKGHFFDMDTFNGKRNYFE